MKPCFNFISLIIVLLARFILSSPAATGGLYQEDTAVTTPKGSLVIRAPLSTTPTHEQSAGNGARFRAFTLKHEYNPPYRARVRKPRSCMPHSFDDSHTIRKRVTVTVTREPTTTDNIALPETSYSDPTPLPISESRPFDIINNRIDEIPPPVGVQAKVRLTEESPYLYTIAGPFPGNEEKESFKHPHGVLDWGRWGGGTGPAVMPQTTAEEDLIDCITKASEKVEIGNAAYDNTLDATATGIETAPVATETRSSTQTDVPSFTHRAYSPNLLNINAGAWFDEQHHPLVELRAFLRTRLQGTPPKTIHLCEADDAEIVRILAPLVFEKGVLYDDLPKLVHAEAAKLVMFLSAESAEGEMNKGGQSAGGWTVPVKAKFRRLVGAWIFKPLLEYCELTEDYNSILQQCAPGARFWECKCFGIGRSGISRHQAYLLLLNVVKAALIIFIWSPIIFIWFVVGRKSGRDWQRQTRSGGNQDEEKKGGLDDTDCSYVPKLQEVYIDKAEYLVEHEQHAVVLYSYSGEVFEPVEVAVLDETIAVSPRRNNQRRWTYSQTTHPLQPQSLQGAMLNMSKSLRLARPKLGKTYVTSKDYELDGSNGRRRAVTLTRITGIPIPKETCEEEVD